MTFPVAVLLACRIIGTLNEPTMGVNYPRLYLINNSQ